MNSYGGVWGELYSKGTVEWKEAYNEGIIQFRRLYGEINNLSRPRYCEGGGVLYKYNTPRDWLYRHYYHL